MTMFRYGNQDVTARWKSGLLGMVLVVGGVGVAHGSDPFMKPTAEELSMKSLPGYPGAAAVVLYREETDRDDIHSVQHYERLKILTEEGKKYANVELRFLNYFSDQADMGNSLSVESIVGRTIHADGTIIPFTGKPYLKTVEKVGGVKIQERVFTLPDVEVGSIIEYRYAERSENFFEAPEWFLQGNLFIKSMHYTWYPTTHVLQNEEGKLINAISWYPILPPGAKVDRREMPAGNMDGAGGGTRQVYEVVVKDVPPMVHEEFMPPVNSFTYRVLFSFTPYHSQQEFWTSEGKLWSKHAEAFMNGGGALQEATAKATAGATTPDEKLQKIYAAVMALENTAYSREHEKREDQAAGVGKTSTVSDVLAHGRGTPRQMTELFIAMARAAGMKAYLGAVPDREERLFTPGWMRFSQLDSPVAIVTVDGKERFFDPGERYCAYGRLQWEHTWVQGLRQTDNGGTGFFQTPGDGQQVNHSSRVANLKLDSHDEVTGKIDVTYFGAEALRWRQRALRGDEESTRHSLRTTMEQMLPKSMEVKVSSIDGLTDYEKPLAIHYAVSGTLGTPTGKRTTLPVDIFQVNASATFPHDKREMPVYFPFPAATQDAVRINIDPALAIEAVPETAKMGIPNRAVYKMDVQQGPNFFTARRDYVFGDVIVPTAEYDQLRTFYSQFEAKDQESVVLKAASATTASAANPGSGK